MDVIFLHHPSVSSAVLAVLAALSGLVALFDFIELLRRSATKPDATFGVITEIAALRLPWIAIEILPFAVLLGGIVAFWRLTRSSELIVARASGVSAWQFLLAPMLTAIYLGGFATALGSPLSSVLLARAEVLDNAYLRRGWPHGAVRRATLATATGSRAATERRGNYACLRC